MTLRIYEPPGAYSTPGMGYSPEGPEVAPCLINGKPYNLLAWTADAWLRTPRESRPGDAFQGSSGTWFKFEVDVDADA